jgi:hypothetical protein
LPQPGAPKNGPAVERTPVIRKLFFPQGQALAGKGSASVNCPWASRLEAKCAIIAATSWLPPRRSKKR